ncbi:MAG: bifunctional diaminohydroxyphosphoribosylaminopyrimidine deaminase/5-amino-6-(5-phosphoribosylamino)uracil reductase RibD [Caulobacteraceae bacterium]
MDASPIYSPPPPPSIASAFELALAIAAERRGATAPNPTVGCVLLDKAGQSLAAAAHQRAGEGHAEVNALAQCREAGTMERIRTAIVTLEPCNHWGRTPPCVEALLRAPVRTVWIGAGDPNANASGGAARLAAAGIEVCVIDAASPLGVQCAELIAPFAKRQATGRPWVTVKQALDPVGSMIPPQGRTTFTSQSALTYAHRLRRRADAILTGSGTVLADDPAFTVRHVADHGGKRRPLAVLDRRGRVPDSWLKAAATRGLDAYRATNLEAALDELGRRGAMEVLVEAGPGLSEAVLQSGFWDEHVLIRQASPETAPGRLETVEVHRRDPARTECFTFEESECSPA